MNSEFPVTPLIIAQAISDGGFATALVNFGALGCWVLWLIYRDKRDSEKRDVQHKENQDSQQKINKALRDVATSLMVAVEAMSSADQTIHELASKMKEQHKIEE